MLNQPPHTQKQSSSPRILAQSSDTCFIELATQYTRPQYYNAVKRLEAGFHSNGAVLYTYEANEHPMHLELSTEEMTTLIASYLRFLIDCNLVRHDERLTNAFLAFEQAPEAPIDTFVIEDDDLGVDEHPF